MRIAILSSFYPLRGGIAQFNASLLEELGKDHIVKAFSFKRQYPGLLFPGKTQYVTPDDEAVPVDAEAVLDTVNPFTYISTARKVREWKPDLLLVRYWMSWFAPSLGYVARHVGKDCRRIAILDNVIPHERRFFDTPLTKYFLRGMDGFVTMCGAVSRDLDTFRTGAPRITLYHPLYSHFGEKLPREQAEDALGLAHGKKNLLFFGLIREYKGLDILLEAFRDLPEDYQLIIAGEPYGSWDKYREILESLPGKDRVKVFPEYIRDSEVKRYFSAADVTVLPYRSATQSGISSISYHFEVPMIVTDTGGLRETVGDTGTGIVIDSPDPSSVRDGILAFFADQDAGKRCREAIRREKERMSWKRFARELTGFAGKIQTR